MARTPTPCSMLCEPSLTMPSSSDQDSSRDSLKIQIGVVHAAAHDGIEHRRQAPLVQTRMAPGSFSATANCRASALRAFMPAPLRRMRQSQPAIVERRKARARLRLLRQIDVGGDHSGTLAPGATAPGPNSRRSGNRRTSRGRSCACRSAPAPPRSTDSRWPAPAAASPNARARSAP